MENTITLEVWIYTLSSVFIVSLISLLGAITITFSTRIIEKSMDYLVSFATGTLFGGAFIHLLPQAFSNVSNSTTASLWIIAGLLLFFIMEKIFRWRHCHIPTSTSHIHPVVPMNVVGDGMHNLIDGLLIGVSFSVSIPLGMATTIAVLFHEVPQEIGDFSILLFGGLSKKKALWLNFLSALMAFVGAIAVLVLGKQINSLSEILIPVTAGGFIYIAGSDLIPEMHSSTNIKKSLLQLTMMVLGIMIMAVLTLWN